MKSFACNRLAAHRVVILLLLCSYTARATELTWDNFSGDSSFQTRINWDPYPDPPNVPGAGFELSGRPWASRRWPRLF